MAVSCDNGGFPGNDAGALQMASDSRNSSKGSSMVPESDREKTAPLDFRLISVQYELYALEENHGRREEHIAALHKVAEARIRTDFAIDSEDVGDIHMALHKLSEHTTIAIPRIVRHSFLVSVRAVYETTVREIADLVASIQSWAPTLTYINGSFLERARKHYAPVITTPCAR